MNPVFNKEHKAFIWNYYEGAHVYSWLLQFPSKESIETFKEMFGRCIFEALNQTPFSKFEVSPRYKGLTYGNVQMETNIWHTHTLSLSISTTLALTHVQKGDQDYVINAFEEESEMAEDDLSDEGLSTLHFKLSII